MAVSLEDDTKTPQYSTGDKASFAYISARDRWPVILTGAIDDIHRALHDTDDAVKVEQGKSVIAAISKLKYEVQHDRALSPIEEDGRPDAAEFNAELKALNNPTWFNAPWLFTECYLYRRLHGIFLPTSWKGYDVFAKQKIDTFKSSRPAVVELASNYATLLDELEAGGQSKGSEAEQEAASRLLFNEMCQICLWGNATDLSLLTSLNYADIQKLQGSAARKASETNILANDLSAAFSILSAARKKGDNAERRVDIVLDNAGFELFVDLVLAGYLLASGLATSVVLRPKEIPWFVSDVTPRDYPPLINALADPDAFFKDDQSSSTPISTSDNTNLGRMLTHWTSLHAEGQLLLRPHAFWTAGGSFWRLPRQVPSLYEDLREAELVIYKGDLNYRKLTGDAAWEPTTPFAEAIGPLGRKSGVRTLALRTCKADVVVGLPQGKDEELRAAEGGGGQEGRKWAWGGKWAVAQFFDGKEGASAN